MIRAWIRDHKLDDLTNNENLADSLTLTVAQMKFSDKQDWPFMYVEAWNLTQIQVNSNFNFLQDEFAQCTYALQLVVYMMYRIL